jgi:hypothetical protein
MNIEFIAQALEIIGAAIFLLLGISHGFLSLQDLSNPRNFIPQDTALLQAMQQAVGAKYPQANIWRAWMGFNLSHSLGLVLFGGNFVAIGLFYFSAFSQILWLQICAILISTTYFIMSLKFWFSEPTISSGIGLTCFVLSVGLLII